MRVAELMSRIVDFAAPEDTARSLAELMGDLDVGAVPVGSPSDPLGVVTVRDILYRVVAKGGDPSSMVATEIMSSPIICCRVDDGVNEAMSTMAANHIRRLGVRDHTGEIVGWLTLADISRKLLLETRAIPEALQEVRSESVG